MTKATEEQGYFAQRASFMAAFNRAVALIDKFAELARMLEEGKVTCAKLSDVLVDTERDDGEDHSS